MDAALLYFDGCPNYQDALGSLETLLAEAGWVGTVEMVNVASPGEAEVIGFRGSPTVLLDGIDPFFDGAAPVGLSCRIFRTDTGLQGVPPVDELRRAIAEHVA